MINAGQQQAPVSSFNLSDTYLQESQRTNPGLSYDGPGGPKGYNVMTGQTSYVPVETDTNPPVNVLGGQTLGGD